MNLRGLSLIFFLILIPVLANSQVVITEIMYDLEGSDSGREWIEIYNASGGPLDISSWKFFENGSNHGLILHQGDTNLASGATAIIVSDPLKFLADWPSFSGTVFDSSYSLSNVGETISIRNPELTDVDSVSFLSDWGANGDGNSLQKVDSTWVALSPTPGQFQGGEVDQEENTPETSSGDVFVPVVNFPVGNITTRILGEKIVLAGADTFFKSDSRGIKGDKLLNARHIWNFGEGSLKEGEQMLHRYIYPGEYIVFLSVHSGSFTATNKLYVTVIPSNIFISLVQDDFIKIKNDSTKEINISLWILRAGNKHFIIPNNTYIKSSGQIIFSNEITKLNTSNSKVDILYPNGVVAHTPEEKPVVVSRTPSVPPTVSKAIKNSEVDIESSVGQIAAVSLNELSQEEETLPEEDIFSKEESSFSKWILALFGLILVSIFIIFYTRKGSSTVDGFTIIE